MEEGLERLGVELATLRAQLEDLHDRVYGLCDLYDDLTGLRPKMIAQSIGGIENRIEQIDARVDHIEGHLML